MTKNDEQFYDELADMFRSPGWKNLLEDIKDRIDLLTDIRTVQSEAEMNHRKGQLMILDNLMSLEDAVETLRGQRYEEDQR